MPGTARRAPPAQPAGDHEVQDEEQLVVELEDDALAEPAQAARPCRPIASSGGSTVRTRNGLPTRTRRARWPTTRALSACRYNSTSGNSGIGLILPSRCLRNPKSHIPNLDADPQSRIPIPDPDPESRIPNRTVKLGIARGWSPDKT